MVRTVEMAAAPTPARNGSGPTAAQVDGAGHLLALVRSGRATTTSELAAATQLARSTVQQRLDFLCDAGLLEVAAQLTGQRGRPAGRYVFRPRAGHVLSAHLGLTGCRTALSDLDGVVLADRLDPVDLGEGPEGLVRVVEHGFSALLRRARVRLGSVVGIGVGVPSELELRGFARSLGTASTGWDRDRLETALRGRYRVPVLLDLDVNLLALAEHRTSWPESEVMVCAKLGTLIDAALVVRGVPVRGVSGLAGELGHIRVAGSEVPCTCGSTGCLNAVASGQALVRRLQQSGFALDHVRDVLRLAEDGVPEAVQALRASGRAVGEALSSVVNLLNPGAIAVWGYLADSEPLLAGIRESVYRLALPGSSEQLEVVTTALGDQAGVRGAAMHVVDRVLAPTSVDRMLVTGDWSTDLDLTER